MKRIYEVDLGGRICPLNFSTKAAKAVDEKFGGLENLGEVFSGNAGVAGIMENVVWLVAIMVEQGAAYKKIVDGEDIQVFSFEDLEVIIGLQDLPILQVNIMNAVGIGMQPEVEIEEDAKNAMTTPGE